MRTKRGRVAAHNGLISGRAAVSPARGPLRACIEVRFILVDAACEPGTEYGLGDQIHAPFEGIGDDFETPERRKDLPRTAEFDR